MKAKRMLLVGGLAVVLVAVGWFVRRAYASDTKSDSLSLRGLKGVEVLVEGPKDDAKRAGLTKSQLQTDVELRLRQLGIPVLTQEQSLAAPGAPYLYVNVNSYQRDPDVPVLDFAIRVELNQKVVLVRDSTIRVTAATWSGSVLSYAGTEVFANHVREKLRTYVDRFANAYLEQNPKK